MALNPKLEFYRFSLNHRDESLKTFQQFAIEELNEDNHLEFNEVTEVLFNHFITSLGRDIAKDDRLKKQVTLNDNPQKNIHLSNRPSFASESNLIYGVINGGHFGKDGIISNIVDPTQSETLGREKSVLSYYFFLLYIPSDHHEGCFAIHSNSREDSITDIVRSYISKLFRGVNYNIATYQAFCPKSFQQSYKQDAVLKNMKFKHSYLENIPTVTGVENDETTFEVKIEVVPKRRNIPIEKARQLRDYFTNKVFGSSESPTGLAEFNSSFEVSSNNSTKSFEFNAEDNDFVPVIYIKDRITRRNADGTPNFEELKDICLRFFNEQVLPELRPDNNATSIR